MAHRRTAGAKNIVFLTIRVRLVGTAGGWMPWSWSSGQFVFVVLNWAIENHFDRSSLGEDCFLPACEQHAEQSRRRSRSSANSCAHSSVSGGASRQRANRG